MTIFFRPLDTRDECFTKKKQKPQLKASQNNCNCPRKYIIDK